MKSFKLIDFWIQVILIAGCFIWMIIDFQNLLYSYFIVGGYQFISMLTHEITGTFTAKGSNRRAYQHIVYIIVACMLLGIVAEPFIYIFIPIAFLAPLMAAYYIRMCYKETYFFLKRPLSILK